MKVSRLSTKEEDNYAFSSLFLSFVNYYQCIELLALRTYCLAITHTLTYVSRVHFHDNTLVLHFAQNTGWPVHATQCTKESFLSRNIPTRTARLKLSVHTCKHCRRLRRIQKCICMRSKTHVTTPQVHVTCGIRRNNFARKRLMVFRIYCATKERLC